MLRGFNVEDHGLEDEEEEEDEDEDEEEDEDEDEDEDADVDGAMAPADVCFAADLEAR